MNQAKIEFAKRLQAALENAGIPVRPAVIEREFNQRYWGKPITLHAVRYWLRGESIPTHDKLLCLAEWLGVEPSVLRYGDAVPKVVRARRKLWDEGIGYQEREIFELFLKLPVPQRKVAREVILALARASGIVPFAGGG
ncbi:MAG: XRE family transcriptional regulator [Rhodocyclales bacterium]|nr:XRE family transcriptional regulator [Rhodocyclales bacterium]